ncbi:hypothetical protein [Nubsella zeaxanthinifaciens]|jgi:hypothetical protein|uniref:hypothetical protein n=1 Tax=Nubsella zeaxanthinifaciens TaxID=392412 RepID=UPI000DE399E0|nr:hypothetical protein [Nubsella zeaxanthinifaciens]
MRKVALACVLLLVSSFAFAQKKWHAQKLTKKFTVNFPSAPTKTAGTTFALKDSTNAIYTATYSFIAQNLKIEERAFTKLVTTNEFANEFLNSLQTTLPQYELSEIKIKQHKNYVSYQTEGKSETQQKSIFMNIIFVDGIYYSLSCALPNGQESANKELFLQSFKISK